MTHPTQLIAFLDSFPPVLCRVVARQGHGNRPMTIRQIAERSGLPKSTVAELSRKRTFADVPLRVIQAFCDGCGVNHFRLKEHRAFLRNAKWGYVYKSARRRTYFGKLLRIATG